MRFNSSICVHPRPSVDALVLLVLTTGCETVSQDLAGLKGAFTPRTAGQAARDMVNPYDADARREGTNLIANAPFGGVEVYLRQYRDMVDNERDPVVKATAIRALARHGQPADAMHIIPHLNHDNVQVRWEAAKGLQRLHNEAAVPELLRVLRNEAEDVDVRLASADALGQYPEDRVFQGLVAALDARELAINTAALGSLQTLTGENFGLDVPAWLGWYNRVASAGAGAAFAKQGEYLYRTYDRDESVWEKLAFWSDRNFEHPAPPAGLRPEGDRSTYQKDSVPPAAAAEQK